jgi:hypothetical protein
VHRISPVNGDRDLAIFNIGFDQGSVDAKLLFALFRINPTSLKNSLPALRLHLTHRHIHHGVEMTPY